MIFHSLAGFQISDMVISDGFFPGKHTYLGSGGPMVVNRSEVC